MKILVIAPRVPHEGVLHAGGVFLLRHLEWLAQEHEVTLVVPDSDAARAVASLAPPAIELVIAGPAPASDRAGTWRDALRQRLRTAALTPAAIASLRRGGLRERAEVADVVELHWPECMLLTRELRRLGVTTPVSVVPHDINAEAARSRVRAARWQRRLIASFAFPVRWRTDIRDLDAAALVQVFKQEDVDVLRRAGVRAEIAVIDPWFEVPSEPRTPSDARRVLFTGALWRPENAGGVCWFLENVWPRVIGSVADARLVIAGAEPASDVRAAAARATNVELTGTVDDLGVYYRNAEVFAAPLFVAGGLKFKVPQAMLYELPVVATPVAAAGVGAPFWAVTDDAIAMAQAIVSALRDPDAATRVGRAAAAWCRERFSFDRSSEAIVNRYRTLARQE